MEKLNEQQSAKLASLSVKQQTSAADLQRIALELQLRQWCVEQTNVFFSHWQQSMNSPDFYQLASQIFDFVIAPLREQH